MGKSTSLYINKYECVHVCVCVSIGYKIYFPGSITIQFKFTKGKTGTKIMRNSL